MHSSSSRWVERIVHAVAARSRREEERVSRASMRAVRRVVRSWGSDVALVRRVLGSDSVMGGWSRGFIEGDEGGGPRPGGGGGGGYNVRM